MAFGALTDRDERSRQQVEDLDVLRVRLETQLKLGERLKTVLRSSALEVELGGDARVTRLDPEVQDALDDLERVVPALRVGSGARRPSRTSRWLRRRLARGSRPPPAAGAGADSCASSDDHLAEHVDRVAVAAGALQADRHLVVGGQRVAWSARARV